MNKRLLLITFLVIFSGLALAATLIFREQVRDQVVVPLLQSMHTLRQMWRSIDSDKIWGIFVLALLVVMLLSLPSLQGLAPLPPDKLHYSRSGRLSHWLIETQQLNSGQSITRYSMLELKKLVLNVVAFRQQCSLREAEGWLQASENRRYVPEQIFMLFRKGPETQILVADGLLAQFWQMVKTRLLGYPTIPSTAAAPSIKTDLEPIIQFLEAQLEVAHDQRPRA